MSTANKPVAIITGSSSGVGRACAIQLAAKGYHVVNNYLSNEKGAKITASLCKQQGVKPIIFQANVANDKECVAMVDATLRQWGRVDVLVNNAGTTKFCLHHNLQELQFEDFQHIYAVNAIGPYQMVRAVSQIMKQQGVGNIVNVASTAGIDGVGSSIAYCASKAALLNMTKSLARVLGPEIRVNAVCPGFIQGEWLKQGLGDEFYEQIKTDHEQFSPLGKTNNSETIAEAILMLLDGPSLMTGEYIIVDGGRHLN